MIAGLETPSSGQIFDGSEEINGPSRKRGMVFQSYTSFDWLTVSKNIEYGMKLNGISREIREQKVNFYLHIILNFNSTIISSVYTNNLINGSL